MRDFTTSFWQIPIKACIIFSQEWNKQHSIRVKWIGEVSHLYFIAQWKVSKNGITEKMKIKGFQYPPREVPLWVPLEYNLSITMMKITHTSLKWKKGQDLRFMPMNKQLPITYKLGNIIFLTNIHTKKWSKPLIYRLS